MHQEFRVQDPELHSFHAAQWRRGVREFVHLELRLPGPSSGRLSDHSPTICWPPLCLGSTLILGV